MTPKLSTIPMALFVRVRTQTREQTVRKQEQKTNYLHSLKEK